MQQVQPTCDANANDFYQAMRDKRKSEMGGKGEKDDRKASSLLEAYDLGTRRPSNNERRPSQTEDRQSSQTEAPSGSAYANAPGATLKEKIALRRAALEKENKEKEQEEEKTDQKTILNDMASKAEFVRKMSKTFG